MKGGGDCAFLDQYPVPLLPLYSLQTVRGGGGGKLTRMPGEGAECRIPYYALLG